MEWTFAGFVTTLTVLLVLPSAVLRRVLSSEPRFISSAGVSAIL